ncbi:hemerythrin domain-containing protein [Kitasatospora sp. DSM 101779]|uniref:hemerythrin domain-containing protein n=1 Tax=Kitasatospora sp. DSM 101779 TaxID=2853165 RepID=UPI0021DA6F78|nr:hemerythrin domain-containing protein [Kitasatospora sp. DSM 101779]MCU7826820.1 hemerythrin domain-containing protein [Kitasatospora sp. DSM 101779]
MAGHGGDVIKELETDHREVEELFAQIVKSTGEHRKSLLDEVTIELVRHSVAEEAYLYPAVRAHVSGGDAMADREVEDHAQVERLLKEIEGKDADDPALAHLAATLVDDVTSHIRDEEQNLFPALRAACSQADLENLGNQVRRSKTTAPTRPHPNAPSSPAARKLLAPGVGLIDRVRDYVSDRGAA